MKRKGRGLEPRPERKTKIVNNQKLAHHASASNWRSRAHSQKQNLADLLKQRGVDGLVVRSSELYREPERFGRSPRNRISELRADGWNIAGKALGESDWCYWLRSDPEGNSYPTARFDDPPIAPRPQLALRPDAESDYMQRVHRERAQTMPLFAEVVAP